MRIARSLAILTILSIAVSMTGCLSSDKSSSGSGGSGGNGGSGGSGGSGSGSASLKSITVQPAQPTLAPGDTKQFTAMGHYSDGSSKDISSSTTWSSANTPIATIDPNTGLAQAVASGTASIVATSNGITGATVLTVAKLTNVIIAPPSISINPNVVQPFTATAHYANNEQKNVTTQSTWSSSDTTIATIVANTGVATAVKAGKVTITAVYQGNNATASLTVRGITSIAVTPIGPAAVAGGTQQFTATATYNDGSQTPVTTSATWSSSNTAVATVNNSNPFGLATAVAVGQTEISATYQGFTGMTAMNVPPPPTFTNASLSGDYVISLTGTDSRGVNFLVGTLHADGTGRFTSGTVDANTAQGVLTALPVTGTYTIFPDGRGDMSFAGSGPNTVSHTLRFVLSNGSNSAQIIEFDSTAVTNGKIEQQSQACSSFGATDIAGSYAFGEGGITPGANATPLAAVGSFTATGSTISTGQRDINNNGAITTQVSFTGSYTQDSTTACRYVVTLNEGAGSFMFAYYAVAPGSGSGKAYFTEIDASPAPVLGGVAEQQSATAIANGNYVFLTSFSGTEGQFQSGGIAGQIGISGTNVTGGEEDEAPVTSNTFATITGGNLTAQGAVGRYLLSETTSTASNPNFIVYVVSANRFFMLRSDAGASNVAMGAGDAQTSTSVANGTYTVRAASLGSSTARADLGLLYIPQGTCAICGIGDRNVGGITSSITLADQTAPSTDGSGRGSIVLAEPGNTSTTYIFYAVTSNKFVVLGETITTDGYVNVQ